MSTTSTPMDRRDLPHITTKRAVIKAGHHEPCIGNHILIGSSITQLCVGTVYFEVGTNVVPTVQTKLMTKFMRKDVIFRLLSNRGSCRPSIVDKTLACRSVTSTASKIPHVITDKNINGALGLAFHDVLACIVDIVSACGSGCVGNLQLDASRRIGFCCIGNCSRGQLFGCIFIRNCFLVVNYIDFGDNLLVLSPVDLCT
jgi:hypothetical protein